eukprot:12923659-Prorocentrum_lima.AAC.1
MHNIASPEFVQEEQTEGFDVKVASKFLNEHNLPHRLQEAAKERSKQQWEDRQRERAARSHH